MKNKLCIYSKLLLLICILSSCNFSKVDTLGRRSSPSIKRSKKVEAFLWEYKSNYVKINDSIQFAIKEIFAEKQYGQYSYSNPSYTIESCKTQVEIILEQNIFQIQGFSKTWKFTKLGIDLPDRLSILYDTSIPPDTIPIDIVRRDIDPNTGLAGKLDDEKIGQFILTKKK